MGVIESFVCSALERYSPLRELVLGNPIAV
jgi:hypothetical protein